MKPSEKRQDTTMNQRVTPEREKQLIGQVSGVSIVGNVVLTGFKMVAGVVGHSGAMVSDAVHSLSDVMTTVIAVIGVGISKKEADRNHPYGHERLECVASMLLAVILMATGVGIGYQALQTILSGQYKVMTMPGRIALLAAFVSIVVKEGMYRYTVRIARILRSDAFMADAWHHRSDAFSSIGSLIGIGGALLGFPVMEPVASVVICLCILKAGYDIINSAVNNMLDTSCGEEFEEQVRGVIEQQAGVQRLDLLQTRRFGNRIYIDAEIAVDGNMRLYEAHQIAERVHTVVEESFADIKHIMIHVNPF
ncbi:MAG: cation diffusion facilitator family transporter [Lachnospiraceae bacterium]|nr:cation diffusion facilitator family transporter [Lachnospiraceae bacterium]